MHQPTFPRPDETMGEIHDRWALAFGHLLLAFGEIERVIDECLQLFPRDEIFESVASMPLTRRLRLVRSILLGRPELSATTADFLKLLEQVEGLSVIRNAVAHNPYAFGFYKQSGSEDLRLSDELTTRKGNRVFVFKEIADASQEAQSLSVALLEGYYALYRHFAHDKPAKGK